MLPSLDYFENYIPTLHKIGEAIDGKDNSWRNFMNLFFFREEYTWMRICFSFRIEDFEVYAKVIL